jgi:HSP20 family protein
VKAINNIGENMKKRRGFFDDFFGFNEFERLHEEMMKAMERALRFSIGMMDEKKLEELAKQPNTYVYGYSIRIGPDGKPIIKEFGNVKPEAFGERALSEEREPLVDVMEDEDKVVIIAEIPGVKKEEIDLKGDGKRLVIKVDGEQRKYYKELELPDNVEFDKTEATYNNGILEIKIPKTKEPKKQEKKIEVK